MWDGRGLADGTRKEPNGGHVPEVDIGVEHLVVLVLHLAADEDEAVETWLCAASTRMA